VLVKGHTDLVEPAAALRRQGGHPRPLHRRQQKRYEDANDGDHDQQLDQRETLAPGS
jgi:hypothetical protein